MKVAVLGSMSMPLHAAQREYVVGVVVTGVGIFGRGTEGGSPGKLVSHTTLRRRYGGQTQGGRIRKSNFASNTSGGLRSAYKVHG